ncbi:MAG TPA: glutathione S-transferase N-terminal domain-containing protein, partial [Pseudomonadota bacterium]|nr:glutathione S-transferase N-terminal domain-containing protein [Pseudomonadota bacterium]
MLKLCGFPISNYFNKVRLALLEKGVPHELDITAFPSQEAQFRQRSPMGKIPFLQTEHGILCESQIICEYIEELHPET